MGAKLLSASLSILWLALLHCPSAKASGHPCSKFLKAQPVLDGSASPGKVCPEAEPVPVAEDSAFVHRFRYDRGLYPPLAQRPFPGAKAYLFRSGLSPPARG